MSKPATPSPVAEELVQTVLQAVLENAPLPLAQVAGPDHVVWAINPAFCTLLSRSAEELIGQRFADLFPQSTRSSELLDRVLRSGVGEAFVIVEGQAANSHYGAFTCWPINAGIGRLSGLMIQVTETTVLQQLSVAVNEALLISSVQQHELTDVADRLNVRLHDEMRVRKELDDALRDSEERFRAAAYAARLTYVEVDLVQGGATTPDNFEEVMGYPSAPEQETDAAIGARLLVEHVVHADRARVEAAVQEFIEGHPIGKIDYRVLGDDGKERWIESEWTLKRDHTGAPLKTFATNMDITARKQAEEAVRASEAFNRSITEVSPNVIYIMALSDHRITWVNAQVATVMGHSVEDVLAMGPAFMPTAMHPEDLAKMPVHLHALAAAKDGEMIEIEYRLKAPNSSGWHWFRGRKSPFSRDPDGSVREIIGTAVDITERKQDEEALRVIDDRLRFALDSAELGTWSLDPATGLFSVDERYQAIFGAAAPVLLLEEGTNTVHPDDRDRVAQSVEQAMRPDGNDTVEIEYRIVHPDGSVHWVLSKGRTTFRGEGPARTLTAFAGTVADITERKQAEEAVRETEARLQLALDSAELGTWSLDTATGSFRSDERYRSIFGVSVQGLTAEQAISNIHSDDRDRVTEAVAASMRIDDPHPYEIEYRVVHPDGSIHWVLAIGRSQFGLMGTEPTLLSFAGTVVDVTERRKLEFELEQTAKDLAEVDRRKSEFLAMLAHELRNPLAPLRNGLELLSMADPDRATWDQAHRMMNRQLDQMVRLIDELMDLSRISRGTVDLRLERVDLRTVLEQALEACKPLIERQEHTLVVDLPHEPVMVKGDSMRLTQVFSNLLNNAAKYTDNGGSIAVRLDVRPVGAVVTVEDNGIGIAPDQVRKVFDMFAQVERANDRVQGGLGIGLNIVKHLVGMHGGNIDVRSDGLGKGSSFTVHLPVSPEPAKKKAVVGVATGTAKTIAPRRILIVDDNVDAASMMALLLGKQGHELRVAHNGEEALAVGAELEPDVVLMDLGMPIMDGFAACRLMRDTPWGAKALIVALSGWGQDEDRVKSTEAGFDHHLVKPIASEALVRLIAARSNLPVF